MGAALVVVAASLAAGGWILVEASSTEVEASSPRGGTGPSVLRDPRALMLAGRRRDVLVGLAVRPDGPVEAFVAGASRRTISPASVTAQVDGSAPLPARPCGRQCFRFQAAVLRGQPARLSVAVGGSAPVRLTFALPPRLPPSAAALFDRVDRRMSRLRTVVIDESLTAGVGAGIAARFTMVAPDRMSYVTSDGDRAVVIGTRRWDRRGGRWRESETGRLSMPAYMWDGASRARLLGRRRLRGERVRVLAVFRPDAQYPAWYRLFVTDEPAIVRAEMLAPSHFMVDRLSRFDRPARITPPRT